MSRKSTMTMVNMEINSHRSKIHIISLYKLTFLVETNWCNGRFFLVGVQENGRTLNLN